MTILKNSWRRAAAAIPVAAVLLASCSPDTLVDVQTPDIITVDQAQSAAGAQAFRISAIGNFARFIGGDQGGTSPLGINLTSGLVGDEIFSARAGTEHMDNRSINFSTFPIDTWTQVGRAYGTLIRAIRLLNEFPPATGKDAQLAELYALKGYVLAITQENYCNGLPFWKGVEGDLASENLTSAEVYARAKQMFDSALTLAGTTAPNTRYLALVGKARVLVNENNKAGAAALVGEVPTSFAYNAQFSKTSAGITNTIFEWMFDTRNFGASNREGVNGLDYVSAADPRVKIDPTTSRGQDGTPTPRLNQYPTLDAPVPVSTGVEARLIVAEVQSAAGQDAASLATLNAIRTTVPGLTPLADAGTPDNRVNQLFRERAFWMYLTAHRLGDMRRLVRQFGRGRETVYPTGAYFKGGVYGTDAVMIPSQAEQNNPDYPGCTDKNP